jgi:polysaccharide export outer membrane protein
LDIDVFGFGDLKTSSEVSPVGTVSLPLVGEVAVQGKGVNQIKRELRGRYGRFIRNPNVDVSLKTYQANRVSVIGEVAKPGVYPLRRPGQLLTEFLSEAGGKTQNASNRVILLPAPRILPQQMGNVPRVTPVQYSGPNPEVGQMGVEIDLEQLIGQVDQPPLLIPMLAGDTVVVPEVGMVEVDGEVNKPGSYKLASRTSVLGAIAAAAGFTYSANVHAVEVIREVGGGNKAAITLDLEEIGLRGARDVRLRDGDLVRVPSEPGRFFGRQVVETLNGIFNGMSINQRVN